MRVTLNDGTVVESVDGREYVVTYRRRGGVAVKVLNESELAFRFDPKVEVAA